MRNDKKNNMPQTNPQTLRDLVLSSEPSPRLRSARLYVAPGPRHSQTSNQVQGGTAHEVSVGQIQLARTAAQPSARVDAASNPYITLSVSSVSAPPSRNTRIESSNLLILYGAQYASGPANTCNNLHNQDALIPANARNTQNDETALVPANVGNADRDHRALFLAALHHMAANNWANTWRGNYANPGPANPEMNIQRGVAQGFVPTTMALHGPGVQRAPNVLERMMARATNMSSNYRGDPGNWSNYSATDLPDDENTSFFITHLPPDVVEREVFDAISDCNRIYAIHINTERVADLGNAACKIQFFEIAGARRFCTQYQIYQTLFVRGFQAHIVRNRNKAREQSGLGYPYSRCILVSGPADVVNMASLRANWDHLFRYQLDRVVQHVHPNPAYASLEIRFGSYRAQASMATIILSQNEPFRSSGVTWRFVRDPCDVQVIGPQRAIGY